MLPLLLSVVLSQQPSPADVDAALALSVQLLATKPAQAPPAEKPGQGPVGAIDDSYYLPSYKAASQKAIREGRSLIVHVGQPNGEILKALVDQVQCNVYSLFDYTSGIIVAYPEAGELWFRVHLTNPTVASVKEALTVQPARKAASQSAVPFIELSGKTAAAGDRAEDSPWLSRAETEAVKRTWPESVPFGNLKFYRLEPRYQRLWTENNGTFKGWAADPLHDEFHPFLVSGGMDKIDRSQWKSVKGLDIPEGKKIAVWSENTDVRAFALVPRWRWRFPVGTIAIDTLFADDRIFEIRRQTKTGDGWESEIAYKDATAAPAQFKGAGQSCISCHSHAGEVVDVPGRIYRRERWGSDGRFSFRPYLENGKLDTRWPLEVK